MNYFPHAYSARLSIHTGTKALVAKEFLFLWQPMRKIKNASKYPNFLGMSHHHLFPGLGMMKNPSC